MICINLPSLDPYFNLAAEEYLLKNFDDDVLMLWQGLPSIVVGKHQNMMAEISYPYILEVGLPVIRRLSGGGTVVHDLGNVNFTYIANGKEGHVVDFKKFTKPVIDFLNNRGVNAYLSGRNDILVDGYKFSGNAEHVYKNRVLHHGTLLFSSDLTRLKNGIMPTGATYSDKSVKSNRSRVANLEAYLGLTVDDFKEELFDYLLNRHSAEPYVLSDIDVSKIDGLKVTKYQSWEWNYGYSPNYTFESKGNGVGKLGLEVQKGVINSATFSFNDEKNDVVILCNLNGIRHDDFGKIEEVIVEKYSFIKELDLNLKELIY